MTELVFFIAALFIAFAITGSKAKEEESGTSHSKYNFLYNASKVFLGLGIIVTVVFLGMVIYHIYVTSDFSNSSEADGFTIDGFNIELKVHETNTVEVTENIDINFYESGHHGIYRFIPSWLKYTNKNNQTQSKKSNIAFLRAEGEQYSTETVGKDKKKIKIGSPYMTLLTGHHKYKILYNYEMGYDTYKGFDEFIFHAYGDYWGTKINNPTVTIHMPKNFNSDGTIHFFADKKRKQDITSKVEYRVEGNTIYARVKQPLEKSLTIDIELPDGYFTQGADNYGHRSLLLCLACIAFVGMASLLWLIYGKDHDKVPETVEFYPPGNLDAAQIAYIAKGDIGKKLSIALVVELASKGYIKINDENGKRKIINNYTLDVNSAIKRQINITKVKDYKQEFFTLHPSAKDYMKYYFPGKKNKNTITNNFDEFYDNMNFLISKGYVKVDYDTINDYTPKALEKIKSDIEQQKGKISGALTKNEQLVYNALFEEEDTTDLSKNKNFYKVFSAVSTSVRTEYEDVINDIPSYRAMLFTSISFVIGMVFLLMAYSIIHDLAPQYSFLYFLALIANIGTFILAILMKRKNILGEQLIARVNGFKNYLKLAEKEQLEAAVEQNPHYFFDILPYAYVLGISKKWIEKFENIPVPSQELNMGSFDYSNTDSINSLSNDVYTPPKPSSSCGSSSGCSSCGGGCSSCGGGCSSCGGGGSW